MTVPFRHHDLETQFYSLALINVIMSKGGESLRSVGFVNLVLARDVVFYLVHGDSDVLLLRVHSSS